MDNQIIINCEPPNYVNEDNSTPGEEINKLVDTVSYSNQIEQISKLNKIYIAVLGLSLCSFIYNLYKMLSRKSISKKQFIFYILSVFFGFAGFITLLYYIYFTTNKLNFDNQVMKILAIVSSIAISLILIVGILFRLFSSSRINSFQNFLLLVSKLVSNILLIISLVSSVLIFNPKQPANVPNEFILNFWSSLAYIVCSFFFIKVWNTKNKLDSFLYVIFYISILAGIYYYINDAIKKDNKEKKNNFKFIYLMVNYLFLYYVYKTVN